MEPVAEANQLVMPLLGLLLDQPRSLRELMSHLGRGSRYEHLEPHSGSVYSLLLMLQQAHWVTRQNAGRRGDLFDDICTLTPAGRQELKSRIAAAIVDPSWTSGHALVTALPLLYLFGQEEAAELLGTRVRLLQERREHFWHQLDGIDRNPTTRAKDDYLDARTQCEITWLEDYRRRITDGPWPTA